MPQQPSTVWQVVTLSLVLILPPLVIVYDALAYRYAGQDATITALMQRWARAVPELPWATLALFVWLWCHLFLRDLIARLPPPLPPQ